MSFAPSTSSSSGNLCPLAPSDLHPGSQKMVKDLIVNNYDYEWDQDDFFSKCVNDVVAAPWNLGKRLDKYHIMEVAWGSRQAVEISVSDIVKKVRAHRWQNGQPQHGIRKSKVSDITYRDLAQLFSEVSLIPAFEIRRNCIVLCLPPLCCIVLHDRVMIHVNNAIELDGLLLKLERLTLAYSKRAEETRGYFLRYYSPEGGDNSQSEISPNLYQGPTTRSMLLTEELIGSTTGTGRTEFKDPPVDLPPLYGGFDKEPEKPSIPLSTVAEVINSYQSFETILPQDRLPSPEGNDTPWDKLHRMILSGNINLIQTIPRFVLFPLEFAFLEILISYAFGEINQEVNDLDIRTTSLLKLARSKVYNISLIDSLRDLKLLLHNKAEDISGIKSAFNSILDTPEDMAMMELTRLFYQSGYYYYTDFSSRKYGGGGGRSGGGGECKKNIEIDINPNLEILLEFFSQEINLISTRVKNLLINLQSAEKHINMIMSFRRNRFAMWDIGCGIAAVGLGIGAVISGTLGMNVPNKQEGNNSAFGIYVVIISASSLTAFVLAWLVTNKTYI